MINSLLLKREILKNMLKGRHCRSLIIIGTYHIYKSSYSEGSDKLRTRLAKLSYFSDRLRRIPDKEKFLITKETSEDGLPHYHFILFFPRKGDDGFVRKPCIPEIKHTRLWYQELDTGTFTYNGYKQDFIDDYKIALPNHYVYVSAAGIFILDPGSRQRYIKYGIIRYCLYILKYIYSPEQRYIQYNYFLKQDSWSPVFGDLRSLLPESRDQESAKRSAELRESMRRNK